MKVRANDTNVRTPADVVGDLRDAAAGIPPSEQYRRSALRREEWKIREAARTLLNPFRAAYRRGLRRRVEQAYGHIDWSG